MIFLRCVVKKNAPIQGPGNVPVSGAWYFADPRLFYTPAEPGLHSSFRRRSCEGRQATCLGAQCAHASDETGNVIDGIVFRPPDLHIGSTASQP